MSLPVWYTIANDSSLEQGDIIRKCPIVIPAYDQQAARELTEASSGLEVEVDLEFRDVIILSQTCDLVEGRTKIKRTLVATVEPYDDMAARNSGLKAKNTKDQIVSGIHPAYFALPSCSDVEFPVSIVSFRELDAVNTEFLREVAVISGKRLRLNSPYREFLSQRVGLFFQRVALPDGATVTL